jgi:hypothetical protein
MDRRKAWQGSEGAACSAVSFNKLFAYGILLPCRLAPRYNCPPGNSFTLGPGSNALLAFSSLLHTKSRFLRLFVIPERLFATAFPSLCPLTSSSLRRLGSPALLAFSSLLHTKSRFLRLFVIPERFERSTHSLEGCCSIQLSYGTKIIFKIRIPFVALSSR